MRETQTRILGLGVVVAFSGMAASSLLSDDGVTRTQAVPVAEIGKSVTLIGRLGQPLGEMMTVTGTWGFPDQSKGPTKDYALRFTVTRVNDRALKEPVEFNVAQVEAVFRGGKSAIPEWKEHGKLDGACWTLRAYETGELEVEPEEWGEESGTQSRAEAQEAYWIETFTSTLVGVFQPPRGETKGGGR